MDEFPDSQNQEEINNLKKPVTNKEIERVIRRLPTTKSTSADTFTVECYQTFKELQPSLTVLTEVRQTEPSNPFFKISIIPISKAAEITTTKKTIIHNLCST